MLDRALKHGDRTLRSAAMQRRVSMLADEGNFPAAWKLFAEAQRHQPDSPSLSHLEVTLLLSEGREAEARERARFWVLRLERLRDPELADLVDLLRNVAEHGGSAMLDMALGDDPEVAGLLELWRSAPAVAVHYELAPQGDSAGPLLPSRALQAALQQWDEVFPGAGYGLLQHGDGDDVWIAAPVWLPVLRAQPILWNTFEVLDALVRAQNDPSCARRRRRSRCIARTRRPSAARSDSRQPGRRAQTRMGLDGKSCGLAPARQPPRA